MVLGWVFRRKSLGQMTQKHPLLALTPEDIFHKLFAGEEPLHKRDYGIAHTPFGNGPHTGYFGTVQFHGQELQFTVHITSLGHHTLNGELLAALNPLTAQLFAQSGTHKGLFESVEHRLCIVGIKKYRCIAGNLGE